MRKRPMRVRDLAEEAELDPEEALILLWDAGLDQFEDLGDQIPRRVIDGARRAVGLGEIGQLKSPDYWRQILGLDEASFDRLLGDLSVRPQPNARRLPKGGVAKLRRYAKVHAKGPAPMIAASAAVVDRAPAARFEWRTVGSHKRCSAIAPDALERIHLQLVADFADDDDPIDPPGVRSRHLLESAAFRPETALGEHAKYPTAEMAAAALLHSIVHNHPFHNGNKRTALVALLVYLDGCNLMLTCSDSDLFRFVLRVAQHRFVTRGTDLADREVSALAAWICTNSRNVDKAVRPLQWRRLRRILINFGCTITPAPGVGNRLNISRTTESRTRFGKPRRVTLSTQVRYSSDGDDASRDTIAKIRADLQLDDDHGVDSTAFYSATTESTAEDFIVSYRKILKRFAKL